MTRLSPQVYYNRKSLARTLMDNQNVVAQVENAIGVTLFIAWVFVTAAVFDGGAVQRTWTALSAGVPPEPFSPYCGLLWWCADILRVVRACADTHYSSVHC